MEKQTESEALKTLYTNLYNSDLKHLGKNLDNLIKAKRNLAQKKHKETIDELEK